MSEDLRRKLYAAMDAVVAAIDAEIAQRGERLLTFEQVAARLSRHVATVQRWAREGRLPVRQAPGEEPRVREADLEDFIVALPLRRVAAAAERPSRGDRRTLRSLLVSS